MMQGGGRFVAPSGLSGQVGQRFFQPPRQQQGRGISPQVLQMVRAALAARSGQTAADVGDRQVGAARPNQMQAAAAAYPGGYDVGGIQQPTPAVMPQRAQAPASYPSGYIVGGQQVDPNAGGSMQQNQNTDMPFGGTAPQSQLFRGYLNAQKPQFSIAQLLPMLAALNHQR